MNRADFMRRLQKGLSGLPADTIAAIVADYESYFADGVHAGRIETELAQALGNPARLAAELRLDFNMRSWRTGRGFRSAAGTLFGVLRLGILDVLFFVPLSVALLCCLIALVLVVVVTLFGGYVLLTAPFDAPIGGPWAAIFHGVGLIFAGICGAAVMSLILIGLINVLTWYVHQHRRALRPFLPTRLVTSDAYP